MNRNATAEKLVGFLQKYVADKEILEDILRNVDRDDVSGLIFHLQRRCSRPLDREDHDFIMSIFAERDNKQRESCMNALRSLIYKYIHDVDSQKS